MADNGAEQKNGSDTLAKLLNQLNLPTLAAIAIFGGGNWLTTKQTTDENRSEIYKAVREIHDLHEALDDFEKRQKDLLAKAADTLDNQNVLLKNQSMMISNQQQLISNLNKRVP